MDRGGPQGRGHRRPGVPGPLSPGGSAGVPPRRSTLAANGWGLGEAIGGFVVGLVLASVAASVALSAVGGRRSPLPVAATVADVVGLWVGLLGAAIVASRRYGRGALGDDYGLRIRPVDLLTGGAVGMASQLLVIPALYVPLGHLDPSLTRHLGAPAQRDVSAAHGGLAIGVLFVTLAVGAPIVEELFFRGLVLRALAGRLPALAAVACSALAFALAHFEAAQLPGLALFGLLLGLLAWRSGRLGPGIAAHAAFNAVAVVSLVHH